MFTFKHFFLLNFHCVTYSAMCHQSCKFYISFHSIFDWVLALGHPYGGHRIMKQGVFKVYLVSSPQALVSKFPLNAVRVHDLIQG